jgi:hypothetical protein
VSRTLAPQSLDPASPDRRSLGLAFHDLEVKPVRGMIFR